MNPRLPPLCALLIAALLAAFPTRTNVSEPLLPEPWTTVPAGDVFVSDPVWPIPASASVLSDGDVYHVSLPLVIGLPAFEQYPPDNRTFELEVLRLVNLERATIGLPALAEHTALTQAARRFAQDMAVHNLTSHIGSDGTTPTIRMEQEGFIGTPWTEAASVNRPTPADVLDGWKKSPRHRDIIFDRTATDIGIGYIFSEGREYTHTCVIDLGLMP